ncbi:hypothetical protein IQ265_10155 [Nodosilinea sp. LEGE 06152]|uniref:hypothetical protein n=1 Tax=Nodosilinea sp. LEGE 06152 TaxID=2777966 RepID=UPI00187E86FD|nr:hypothetical protein [Nodosilinea sp. LEGE 06152]MBE9157185.1 hypothetical protein [Nodosilinea sp. LEGE 06152]
MVVHVVVSCNGFDIDRLLGLQLCNFKEIVAFLSINLNFTVLGMQFGFVKVLYILQGFFVTLHKALVDGRLIGT